MMKKKTTSNSMEEKEIILEENAAKSLVGMQNFYKQKERENKISRTVGLLLSGIQLCMSISFIFSLIALGMLPTKYITIIVVILGVLEIATFIGQFVSKKNAITGKILSILFSFILLIGTIFILKADNTVEKVSGGDTKKDRIVVAVLADDSAETIQDAMNYRFGVQYKLKTEQITTAVGEISNVLGKEIRTVECDNLQEQAERLYNGRVDAVIFNEAYTSIIEEEYDSFSEDIKIIYEHEITTKLVLNSAAAQEVLEKPFTVYISGIDVYGEIETNSRSDVNIIAEVNPVTHQVLLVTTPRDYYVELPGVSEGMGDKLTHAGIYGVDISMATLDQLYGIETEFYARVNFTSMIEMIDALGGVDVYSEFAFTTSTNAGLVFDVVEGMNHFNGKQALAFCRERKNVPGGDTQRGKNQQAVITAMIKKAISPAILVGANDILSSVSGNVDTNMTQQQIQALIRGQLENPEAWKIKSMAAESISDFQYCYSAGYMPLAVEYPVEESVEEIKAAFIAVENGQVFEDSEVAE